MLRPTLGAIYVFLFRGGCNGEDDASIVQMDVGVTTSPVAPLASDKSAGLISKTATAASRDQFSFEVHVIGCKRPLDRLLNELSDATCLRDRKQELFIHIDACGLDVVGESAELYTWPCGNKTVIKATQKQGLRRMWFSVIDFVDDRYQKYGDAAVLVLEDDMQVSKVYALHLESIFETIRSFPSVVGASLSPIRVTELAWSDDGSNHWHGDKELGSDIREFMSAIPSSWGGAYWSSVASRFSSYIRERMKFHSYEVEATVLAMPDAWRYSYNLGLQPDVLTISSLRSTNWPSSWKKHLIEFMYVNGLVMAYPNLPGEAGYGTSLCLSGEHMNSTNEMHEYRVAPVVDELLSYTREVRKWPIFDLHMRRTSLLDLLSDGFTFLQSVPQNYSQLKDVWLITEPLK